MLVLIYIKNCMLKIKITKIFCHFINILVNLSKYSQELHLLKHRNYSNPLNKK